MALWKDIAFLQSLTPYRAHYRTPTGTSRTITGEISQNHHTFALFDPTQIGHFMTPAIIASIFFLGRYWGKECFLSVQHADSFVHRLRHDFWCFFHRQSGIPSWAFGRAHPFFLQVLKCPISVGGWGIFVKVFCWKKFLVVDLLCCKYVLK